MNRNDKRIAMLTETLTQDADVLTDEQANEIRRAIGRLQLHELPAAVAERVVVEAYPAKAFSNVAPVSVEPVEPVEPVEGDNRIVPTLEFVAAGKATFTFANKATGVRFTFKVERPDEFRGSFFGSVMKGSDNEHDYKYVGMVGGRLELRETKGSKFKADTVEFKALAIALDIVFGRRKLPAGYELLTSGTCGACGRTLTTPESIKRGIGPDCYEKLSGRSVAA